MADAPSWHGGVDRAFRRFVASRAAQPEQPQEN